MRNTQHAKSLDKYKTLLNSKINRLTILCINDVLPITANCICDCGKKITVPCKRLISGNTKSCGCLRRQVASDNGKKCARPMQKPDGESAKNRLIRCYKKNATKSDREYTLTNEEFSELTKQNCVYCGSAPSNEMKADWKNNKTGSYVYNGLDRIDNTIGYTKENVVPCCYLCNRAKWRLSQPEFLNWIKKIITHNTRNA